jgi:uncharacterized membrane protein
MIDLSAAANINPLIALILLTFFPFLELRASIPYGILVLKMNWIVVFFICVASNIILGVMVYFFLDKIMHLFLKVRVIAKLYSRYVERVQKKIHKHVERYGEFAVAAFIGVPLPGSGVYSGALAAYLIGLGYRKFIIANIIGVVIAGIIVTALTLSGTGFLAFLAG